MTPLAPDDRPTLGAIPAGPLGALLGGTGRAAEVFALLRRGVDPFSPEGLHGGPRERLEAACRPLAFAPQRLVCAPDGTAKFLLSLADGQAVEAVLIPTASRTTLCVSSQVGCARGCTFCMTATMGRVRNLRAEEIVAQVLAGLAVARERGLPPLRNLVFMGMGEPLDNLAAVEGALAVIVDPRSLAFAPRFVTVSTVGTSPHAIRAAGALPGRLAWSVHAAKDELRRRLVPTTRHPMHELRDAFADVLALRDEPLFVEVTLIDGVNDDEAAAAALVELLLPLPGQTRVNLLPMNPIANTTLRRSPPEKVEVFSQHVRAGGLRCLVRKSRGDEDRAACGQLAVEARRPSADAKIGGA